MGWISAEDLRALATNVAAVAAILVTLTTVWRLPVVSVPLKWLSATLISEPLTHFFHRVLDRWAEKPDGPISGIDRRLSDVEYQLRPNGGSSLRDRVDATARQVGAADAPSPSTAPPFQAA